MPRRGDGRGRDRPYPFTRETLHLLEILKHAGARGDWEEIVDRAQDLLEVYMNPIVVHALDSNLGETRQFIVSERPPWTPRQLLSILKRHDGYLIEEGFSEMIKVQAEALSPLLDTLKYGRNPGAAKALQIVRLVHDMFYSTPMAFRAATDGPGTEISSQQAKESRAQGFDGALSLFNEAVTMIRAATSERPAGENPWEDDDGWGGSNNGPGPRQLSGGYFGEKDTNFDTPWGQFGGRMSQPNPLGPGPQQRMPRPQNTFPGRGPPPGFGRLPGFSGMPHGGFGGPGRGMDWQQHPSPVVGGELESAPASSPLLTLTLPGQPRIGSVGQASAFPFSTEADPQQVRNGNSMQTLRPPHPPAPMPGMRGRGRGRGRGREMFNAPPPRNAILGDSWEFGVDANNPTSDHNVDGDDPPRRPGRQPFGSGFGRLNGFSKEKNRLDDW